MKKTKIINEITNTRRTLFNKFEDYEQLRSFVDRQMFDLEDRIAELLASQDLIASVKAHNRCYDLHSPDPWSDGIANANTSFNTPNQSTTTHCETYDH